MATPKSKTSKARSAQRRSHDALSVMPCSVCKTCGEKKRPHHVCPACGAKEFNEPKYWGIKGRMQGTVVAFSAFFMYYVRRKENNRN